MIKIYGEYGEICQKVINSAAEILGFRAEDIDVEISFVSEEEIKTSNNEYRGIDKITDVLSFQNLEDIEIPFDKDEYPTEINIEDNSLILGEILICTEQAKRQAEEYGHSLDREIGFLTCHGLLHLFNYDHEDSAGEAEMNALCEEILANIGLERVVDSTVEKAENKDFKSGFVAIMGKPNAGKSTLINTIVGEKVAIVSWKPQTTRNRILGIYNEENYQIIFIDTPGLHKPKNTLGSYMIKTASAALDGVDCVLYVVDCEKEFDSKDKEYIESYVKAGQKVVVAVNKVDHVTREKVFEILTELKEVSGLQAIVPISALRSRNIEPLKEEIKKLLTDNIKYYGDELYTDRNMRFIAAEIIREKALRLLDKEVPYGIGVEVREYKVRENGITDINADIICEKEAHKPIVLGKGGSMIKKIATYARQDLETAIGGKVFITLFVRVKADWRDSESVMRLLGYDPKNPE